MSIQAGWIKVAIITSWKEHGHLFEEAWTPYTQECFVSRLVEIGLLVLEKLFLSTCVILDLDNPKSILHKDFLFDKLD